jgi:hypothetical protein
VTEVDNLAPLKLVEYDYEAGLYGLILDGSDMGALMDVFEECGAYGNGYGWEGVAASAVRAHAPEIADRIEYDPEAGMFAAHGNDEAALRRLGVLLHEAYHDRQVLAELIRSGDPDWFV